VRVQQTTDMITLSTDDRTWQVPTSGAQLIQSATVAGKPVMGPVGLTLLCQDAASLEDTDSLNQTRYTGTVTKAVVEQNGPVRCVVRLEGTHQGHGRDWLPFTVRLYLYAGAENLKIVHTFIFDGDHECDFIRGMGLTAALPMTDEAHNRHIRFSGQDDGVWGEAVRPITGLRRDPGKAYRDAQIAGHAIADTTGMKQGVAEGLKWIPTWSDFTLSQPNADGYSLRKRTQAGQAWIDAVSDHRASGLVYAGGVSGGVALGLKDFWQRAPSRLDVRGAASDTASVTAWLWSPDAPAMDLRSYRPVWGMESFAAQNAGLNITYEDYEPGYDTPYGIACTSELTLWALAATPERARFAAMAKGLTTPPRLTVSPQRLHLAGVFGEWTVSDSSTPVKAAIENRYTYQLDYYLSQVEQHRWYGLWNYGDVMHTYDADRHVWRYDIGGFAWDNSELSSDMMFWYGYLRSGRADVFRMAEAMTRHTGEVDVYHIGKWRGLGTRHGVQHFSDSSKQPRVSQPAFRRFYYYLTTDERCGDLMRELVRGDEALTRIDIARKTAANNQQDPAIQAKTPYCSFGTDWGSFLAAWLTEWERTGDTQWRDRIVAGMTSIAKMKRGGFTGGARMDLKTGAFIDPGDQIRISHLNGVFGVFEMHMELMKLVDVPAYKKVWLDYCRLYNAPAAELTAFLGSPPKGRNLREGHSRYTAYAARELNDKALAKRAWEEFLVGEGGSTKLNATTTHIAGPAVLSPVDEDPRVSTNGAAQWALAATANLSLIGDSADTFGADLIALRD
ncbi:MAG: Tat pathway signal sequence domain protein, partial [Asticcacaulis sp.]